MALRLSELQTQAQLRELSIVRGVDLCSNDYLGLSSDPRLQAALSEGLEYCGRSGATGSRLLSGHHDVWDELEAEFAGFAGTEAALFFNSGFAANTGLLSALLGPGDFVYSDALNHASIIDGIRLSRAQRTIYPHRDLDFLEDALRRHSQAAGSKVIVTESIFSMDGDHAPLRELFQLAGRYGAEVIVDEAHATGVCGPRGRGLVAGLDSAQPALAVVHTCGKALASAGAFVCGSQTLKQFLINHARSFIFSTGLPPYMAFQVRAAVRLADSMEAERSHLVSLAARLRTGLNAAGFGTGGGSHIVPLVVGSNQAALELAEALQVRGFAVRAIRSPSVPVGAERLRLSLHARLSFGDIERFADAAQAVSSVNLIHG
ncbi:MAG TPA: 8-amino-7-oxononanoate synthase [Candidatus Saccharimonadales bacterium]|jgi:8-amino-7-oxononanoate synthase|nr:8-amino-7-oxononanoate synthase [Candidatus Saccharimonadales bacterium]